MNCTEVRALLDAHVDGELDLLHDMALERHLAECAACTRALQSLTRLRGALANPELRYAAPPGLAARLDRTIGRPLPARSPAFKLPWPSFSAGMAFACLLFLLWNGLYSRPAVISDAALENAVLSSHVRALMASHLTDVPSSDKHTVKPWFNGKLDFSPPVQDLKNAGFPLIGGRLDYLDDRPVAALVYRRRRHFINLFIWPARQPGAEFSSPATMRQGYHLIHWEQANYNFWAVSDLGAQELEDFVKLVRADKSGSLPQ